MVENKIPFPHVKASPNEDERVWAMVCHLSVLFGGIVIPFLILSFKGKSSRFIAFHARQATFYQGAVLLLMLTTVGFALFLSPLFVYLMKINQQTKITVSFRLKMFIIVRLICVFLL